MSVYSNATLFFGIIDPKVHKAIEKVIKEGDDEAASKFFKGLNCQAVDMEAGGYALAADDSIYSESCKGYASTDLNMFAIVSSLEWVEGIKKAIKLLGLTDFDKTPSWHLAVYADR